MHLGALTSSYKYIARYCVDLVKLTKFCPEEICPMRRGLARGWITLNTIAESVQALNLIQDSVLIFYF